MSGRAYLDLQQMARRRSRPTQELLLTYVLERVLFWLSRSAYRDRLVLSPPPLAKRSSGPIRAGRSYCCLAL
jgi:hypothetical protein